MQASKLIAEKIKQAVQLLHEFNLDCWLTFVRESDINGDPSLAFLSETALTWHSAFIVHKSGETCAIVGRYDVPAIEALGVYNQVVGYVEGIKKPFTDHFLKTNPKTIAINYSKGSEICDGITLGMYLTLQDFLEETAEGMSKRLVSSEKLVSALRERKSSTEIERIKGALGVTEKIWEAVAGYMKPGMTEKQVAAFIKEQMKAHDVIPGWDEASCPAVFSGIGIAEAHFAPGDKIIEKGELINIDFGVRKNGYISDMQRAFYVPQDDEVYPPQEVQHGFNTIRQAIADAKKAMRPGVKAFEIDAIARDIVTGAGYEEFPHGLGHQLGIFVHDGTALLGPLWEKYAQKPVQALEENMVFTIEPRVKIPGRGMVSIEEMVLVTATGAEWLSPSQKELIMITG